MLKDRKFFLLFGLAILLLFPRPAQAAQEKSKLLTLSMFNLENKSFQDKAKPDYSDLFSIFPSILSPAVVTTAAGPVSDQEAMKAEPSQSVKPLVAVVQISQPAPDQLEAWFAKYGQEYHVDPLILRKICHCESTFNPLAVNGPFAGLFQFMSSTWSANRQIMGLDPNPDLRFNPEEAIKTAAFKISRDGTGAWPVCGK